MAAIDRALSAIALCSMEYHQSEPFLQKTNTSGIVEPPFLGASSSQLAQINSIPVAGGLNNNGSCFNMCSPFSTNPVPEAESMGMFLGDTVPMLNPERSHVLSQMCTGLPGRVTKKHKHDEADYGCPSKRRKFTPSTVFEECHAQATYAGDAVRPCWNSNQLQLAPPPPPVCQPLGVRAPEMQPILSEDMEEAPAESQSDAALRRIRDIESRLVIEDEDDEEETEGSIDHLPTLIMSDVLVQSLKHGLDESLTKKIVDSISRPSMELVLWKPQPEFIDKLQSCTSGDKDDSRASKKGQRTTSKIPFLQNIDLLGVDRPHTMTLSCDTDPKEEEEMEL